VCPLAKVFFMVRVPERLSAYSNVPRCSRLQTCANTSAGEAGAHDGATARPGMVNFRYGGGCMHIALNVCMADSEVYETSFFSWAACSSFDPIS
jgi:hypothetical protein